MKKYCIFFLLVFLVLLINLSIRTKAEETRRYDIYYFKTDKECFFTDQMILINSSWNLDYPSIEIDYLQIQIYNESEIKIWSSDTYTDKTDPFNIINYVSIQDLYIPSNVSEFNLKIRLYYYWDNGGDIGNCFLENEIDISILKRNCSCELFNFKNNLNIEIDNNNKFLATFYNESKYLMNHLVFIKINSVSISKLTNTNGSIELELRFPENLTIGLNKLVLEIKGDIFLRLRTFEYSIMVIQGSGLIYSNGNNSKEKDNEKDSRDIFNGFSFLLIIFISIFLLSSIYYNNNKKVKQQKIVDITIRN